MAHLNTHAQGPKMGKSFKMASLKFARLSLLHVLYHLGGAVALAPAAKGRCLVDKASARQLAHQICEITGGCAYLSHEWCAQQCRIHNYSIAGVEAGHQCCCGNELTNSTALANSSDCNITCTGNASETCGGIFRLWAFDPANTPNPPPPPEDPTADPRWIPNGRLIRTGETDDWNANALQMQTG